MSPLQFAAGAGRSSSRIAFQVAGLAAVYFVAGKLGLSLAVVNASATPVWPPTGIALAALLILGYRVWPGVLLGAFLVNLTTAGTLSTSLGIAIGNTLEGLFGAYLANRFAGGARAFDRSADVFRFGGLAALLSTALGATIGVSILSLGGLVPPERLGQVWMTWWLGDAAGALVVSPVFLVWALERRGPAGPGRFLEGTAFVLSLLLVGLLLFGGGLPQELRSAPLGFLSIPLPLWAAFRFGQRGAALAALGMSGIALWGTLRGVGPFVGESPNTSLLLLQGFMGVIVLTSTVVAAEVAERGRAEESLRRLNEDLEGRVAGRSAQLQAANEALLEETTRLLQAEEVAHLGAWAWDIPADRVTFSDELWRIFDLLVGEREATYAGLVERIHPDDRARATEAVERIRRDHAPFSTTLRIVRPDGAQRTVEARGKVVLDAEGKLARLLGTVLDVTERRRAEEEAERFFNLSLDMICVASTDGYFKRVSPAFQKTLGYEPSEFLSRPFMDFVHPDDVATTLAEGEKLAKGAPTTFFENRYRCRDGSYRWLAWTAQPTPDGMLYGIARDITEQKRSAEEQVQRAAELARSNADLEQFAYVASHDLQEPLRMVASFTQLLARRYRGRLDARADTFIAHAVEGAKRMQELIQGLLAYSRVGREGGDFTPTDCDEVLRRTVADLGTTISASGGVVTLGKLPTVCANPVMLGQLFQNLLANALKFRGREAPWVHVSAEKDGLDWLFTIQDNGIGIAPEHQERIFKVFQRLHGSEEYPGTGLGLALCKKIVEIHGGRISVESEPGLGSTFRFTIPGGAE